MAYKSAWKRGIGANFFLNDQNFELFPMVVLSERLGTFFLKVEIRKKKHFRKKNISGNVFYD